MGHLLVPNRAISFETGELRVLEERGVAETGDVRTVKLRVIGGGEQVEETGKRTKRSSC
jgi:hypothetical protein